MAVPPEFLPPYLLRSNSEWRAWLERFPYPEPGGYVPAHHFLESLQNHLDNSPDDQLSADDIRDLREWFRSLLRPNRAEVQKNQQKNKLSYAASAVPIVVDIFAFGAASITVAAISGLLLLTSGAADIANGKQGDRIEDAADIFENWLHTKRT